LLAANTASSRPVVPVYYVEIKDGIIKINKKRREGKKAGSKVDIRRQRSCSMGKKVK
jgi:hypothetical protein